MQHLLSFPGANLHGGAAALHDAVQIPAPAAAGPNGGVADPAPDLHVDEPQGVPDALGPNPELVADNLRAVAALVGKGGLSFDVAVEIGCQL